MELKLITSLSEANILKPFNRTLWNWNTTRPATPPRGCWLLIEPYGIETMFKGDESIEDLAAFNRTLWNWNILNESAERLVWCLLIEPYGIETENHWPLKPIPWPLLIEPYGIETNFGVTFLDVFHRLLIEPYGIETLPNKTPSLTNNAF